MDDHLLPLDVARALMDRYGSSALDVAQTASMLPSRAAT
ncbi:MAG: hypothetical protein FD119_2594 [Stygiobacter sp.]|nr:MAG: hypothetical protein FD119_2594 [Stygiobacter sp.]